MIKMREREKGVRVMDKTTWATEDGFVLKSTREQLRNVAKRDLGTDNITLYSIIMDTYGRCILAWSWWRGGHGGAEAICDETDVPVAARAALMMEQSEASMRRERE
jgi:hypothetical protein